jgi:hypothetical protein
MRIGSLFFTTWIVIGLVGIPWKAHPESIRATIRLTLPINPSELSELHEVVTKFADKEGLQLHDLGPKMPPKDGRPVFLMRVDEDKSFFIVMLNIERQDEVSIGLYNTPPRPDFAEKAERFQKIIKERWPQLAPYQGIDIGPFKNL